MVTYPTYARPVEFEVIARTRNFKDMHPTMRERLQALMEDSGGKVGWGQGVRTPQQQLQLFLQRHSPDPNGKIIWNGEKYSRHTGAPAAPPGSSMHELGLAADMAGDFAWLGKNVGRFGLMTFADVNNEPWHVQPVELPRGRKSVRTAGFEVGCVSDVRHGIRRRHPAAPIRRSPTRPRQGSSAKSDVAAPTLTPALVATVRRHRPGGPGADGSARRARPASGCTRQPRRRVRNGRPRAGAPVPA